MKNNDEAQRQEGRLRYWHGGITLVYFAAQIMWELPGSAWKVYSHAGHQDG